KHAVVGITPTDTRFWPGRLAGSHNTGLDGSLDAFSRVSRVYNDAQYARYQTVLLIDELSRRELFACGGATVLAKQSCGCRVVDTRLCSIPSCLTRSSRVFEWAQGKKVV